MHLYVTILGISVPAYGLLIMTGMIIANCIAFIVLKKNGLNVNDLIILEAYGTLGAFIGAKLLYLIVSYKIIEWSRILEQRYFNHVMQSGFVFYGGLIGGITLILLAGRFHKIQVNIYIRKLVFVVPIAHCFGRIGCFMAGCCYGKPYDGVGAVVFPKGSYAPAGIKLFPVQLVEAIILLMIGFSLMYLQFVYKLYYTIEYYLITYGMSRFCLEFLRYDYMRGSLLGLSTSQWISILLVCVACRMIVASNQTKRKT